MVQRKRKRAASTAEDDEAAEYEVESILNKKIKNNVLHYQVKWKGYDETTWEPESNLHCRALIRAFEARHEALEQKTKRARTVVSTQAKSVAKAQEVNAQVASQPPQRKKSASNNPTLTVQTQPTLDKSPMPVGKAQVAKAKDDSQPPGRQLDFVCYLQRRRARWSLLCCLQQAGAPYVLE